ncbi:MAG: UDP-N-acetylmuramoyl-L-alanyl-D-glutamate--2,6-diaminopimelate ligase [Veillonellales bacterium]
MKTLQELAALLPNAAITGDIKQPVQALTHDSRQVRPGTLFVCLTGTKVDGHDYIEQARQKGAIAVLVEKAVAIAGITVIKVPDTRLAMQQIAPYFYDYPAEKLRIIGITGTNGKTTTTYLIRSILQQAGFRVGVIGTIQIMIDDQVLPIHNTTPDVIELQSVLAKMVVAKMDYVVMEVSSHALALNRIAGCEFDVAVFTNMTRDHLDFHGTFENYLAAKSRLFQLVSEPSNRKAGKAAVVNIDDPAASTILRSSHCRTISYSVNQSADLQAKDIDIQARGASFVIVSEQGDIPIKLKITGVFNVYNVLAAAGTALAEAIDGKLIKQALENFVSVPGRFELVAAGQPFSVIVDFAHTPDGLENILKTVQQFAKGKIITVFGCGGDRDRTKRPIMGHIAAELSDVVIATSDNPRTEEPEAILSEIEAGILKNLTAGKTYEKIIDRRQAIQRALELAKDEDTVIIAGKGHEPYQILKERTIAFDDREIVRELVRGMK